MTGILDHRRFPGGVVGSTLGALRAVLRRRDGRLVLLGGAVGYLVVYLVATGALSATGGTGFSLVVVDAPLQRMIQSMGYLSFEPIALVEVVGLTYLFSPIDAAIAVVLAGLVGANLSVTYLGIVQPRQCGLQSSTGVIAAVPALFSGAACCGPVILIVLGLQISSAMITVFQLLVPVALVLLVGSLLVVGRRVDPELL